MTYRPTPEQLDEIGRIIHESWCKTMRAQSCHGLHESCNNCGGTGLETEAVCLDFAKFRPCPYFNPNLINWEKLSEQQKSAYRHAADALIERGVPVKREQAEQMKADAEARSRITVCIYCGFQQEKLTR